VITVKKNPGDSSDAIRPSILVFHLEDSPKKKLKTTTEWNAFIKPFIQDKQLLVLRQDISQSGRYIIEFTSRHHDSKSDLRSIYLVTQAQDNSVTLFIYDGLGPATARNLPRVRAFLQGLDTFQLDEMYGDDIKRRATR
jgi:hypothetical protein